MRFVHAVRKLNRSSSSNGKVTGVLPPQVRHWLLGVVMLPFFPLCHDLADIKVGVYPRVTTVQRSALRTDGLTNS